MADEDTKAAEKNQCSADLHKTCLHPFRPTKEQLKQFKWPLEKGLFQMFWVALLVCPFWLFIDRKSKSKDEEVLNRWRAWWVIAWLGVLTCSLLTLSLFSQLPWIATAVIVVFASVRLVEIYVTGLGTILDQVEQVGARNLITIAFYFLHVILIFALLCGIFAADSFVLNSAQGSSAHASGGLDFLYISWSNVTSLGNAYAAEGFAARALEISTTTTGLFLFGVLLAFGITEIRDTAGRR